jgi:hypothetical protein
MENALPKMEQTCIALQAYKYCLVVDETKEEDVTILEVGKGGLSKP